MELVVSKLTWEAEGVRGIELRASDGAVLPAFSAGAHVDLHLPSGLCRQYSLTNDPDETHRYCIGVGLSRDSRGGSKFVHEQLAMGDRLRVGEPRSLFGIDESAGEHVFIAGGIGITPILSMIRWCIANRKRWRLLYCVRSRSRAAFLWTLAPHQQLVSLHVDEEAKGSLPDLGGYLSDAPPGAHVYCCGPAPLMDAAAAAASAASIPKAATHFERFSAPEASTAAGTSRARSFTIFLKQQDRRITVPCDSSILETLESNGVALPFSCREGLCRTCEVPLLHGCADHRDYVLSDEERAANKSIMVCVSRAISDELVLDA